MLMKDETRFGWIKLLFKRQGFWNFAPSLVTYCGKVKGISGYSVFQVMNILACFDSLIVLNFARLYHLLIYHAFSCFISTIVSTSGLSEFVLPIHMSPDQTDGNVVQPRICGSKYVPCPT